MRILAYIFKRVLAAVPVLIGVSILTFIISHAIPGDPARIIVGPKASKEAVEAIRKEHGLDRPLPVQYVRYMKGLVQGDLGQSIRNHRPVTKDLADFFPATLELTLASLFLCLTVGIPLGILAAVQRNRLADHVARVFSVIGVSTPVFWLGLMLLLLFYRNLGWLPGSGRLDITSSPPAAVTGLYVIDAILARDWALLKEVLSHLILPAFCLSYVYLAVITRIVRSSMIAVLGQDYITTACVIPTVTIAGLSLGELLGGAILTETIFAWPGMGKYVVDSINALDFPAIMGFTLLASTAYVAINLGVDVLYAFLNPRIRY